MKFDSEKRNKDDKDDFYFCCVKNCHKKLNKDQIVKFNNCIFCKKCFSQMIKQSLMG